MNEANLKAILKGVGLPDSILTDIEKTDFDAKGVIAAYNESQKAHFKPLIENEIRSDIEETVREETTGKWLGTLNNDLKKFGVPLEKIKDLKIHEKLKLLNDTLEAKYKASGTADEMVKVQEENIALKNELTEWKETKFNAEIEKVKKEESGKTVNKLVDLDLRKQFASIPADEILGKKHTDGIYLGSKSHLTALYDFGIDEKEESIPYHKGTQKRVQVKNSEGKEMFAVTKDLFLNSLDELGFRNKNNGGEGSGQQGHGGGNGQKQKSQRLLEMEAAISKG